jgi:patatin-like phospholipase
MRPTAKSAFERLGIPSQNRALLSLDGGGIRGIMTIQLLKALEDAAGAPCHQIFDMVAGTSTGAIIAGLIASGRSAAEIDDLYQRLVTKVFVKRDLFANQFVNPPAWSKSSYRKLLKELIGNVTLEGACKAADLDLLITAHDVSEGEETFFSYLRERAAPANRYAGVLLRGAMEATMSAPTYFRPLERFVDGGTTTYNNPALAAVLEAVQFGAGGYSMGALSVFSFGTGCRTQLIAPEDVPNPRGLDTPFWLSWLMTESPNDASDMQSDLLRARRAFPGCDYRRFQISLDSQALAKLPNANLEAVDATDAQRLSELGDAELSSIQLDNVRYFPVMKVIGEAYAQFLREHAAKIGKPMFGYDLTDPEGKEILVTRTGDVARIARQLGDPDWLDAQPT